MKILVCVMAILLPAAAMAEEPSESAPAVGLSDCR
jgi:hypothetical protein